MCACVCVCVCLCIINAIMCFQGFVLMQEAQYYQEINYRLSGEVGTCICTCIYGGCIICTCIYAPRTYTCDDVHTNSESPVDVSL